VTGTGGSRVTIIGGGVIGLSVAWRAARAGLSVAVVDPDPGSGASHFAAGMIAPIAEAYIAEQELLALGRRGGRAELHVGGNAGAVIHDGVLEMVRLEPRG